MASLSRMELFVANFNVCECVWTWRGDTETLKKTVKMQTNIISRWVPPKLGIPFHGLYVTCRVQYWGMIWMGSVMTFPFCGFFADISSAAYGKQERLLQFTCHSRECQDLLGVTVVLPYRLLLLFLCKHLHYQFAIGNQVFWRPLKSSSAKCTSDDANKQQYLFVVSYSNKIKSAKTEDLNMPLFDYCQGIGAFLEIKGNLKVLLMILSDKSGAQHFYKHIRDS